MSFGAIFTALYFLLVAAVLTFSPIVTTHVGFQVSRWGGIALLFFMALALFGNRVWARWCGLLLSIAIASGVLLSGAEGPIMLTVLMGAIVGAVLLLFQTGGSSTQRSGPGPITTGLMLASGASASIVVVGLLFASQSGSAIASPQPTGDEVMRVSRTRVEWTDFGAALQLGEQDDLPILVSFETPWCGYCKKMNQVTWRDQQVIDRLGGIIAVRINAESAEEAGGYRGVDVARRYKVQGYPTVMLMRADGRVISRTSGYLAPSRLLSWLDGQLGRRAPASSVSTIPVSGS
ncbi:MAG: thioredoxin fold domain-containing protein [Acidobacteriota bacterium]|nr:thioredoxin fold domain-containing protein [Acidobacteriota bacterium]MDH3784920.1 thioredoxin fold domain-containing protein [Acidobacteriota bacterium]